MRRRRDPRRPMNLKANIARLSPLHPPDVQPHPNPQLPNLTRPRVCPQRTLRRDRRPTRRHHVLERRKKRVSLDLSDKPTLARDRATNQLVMLGQHRGPIGPKLSR